ncbi:hypothetical protein ACFPYI_13755 [Halomarina salina]|uniref:DUF5305 domain-containing protein n=1 Tax=Halomarina salina TaxID=1872699 RepID=A0ABD5RP30_9EURY|nr:hypothetical protein [Halomarina salina]
MSRIERTVPAILLVMLLLTSTVGVAVAQETPTNSTSATTSDAENPGVNTDTTSTPSDSSEWSVERVTSIAQQPLDEVTVDSQAMANWYYEHKSSFSANQQVFVEAWLAWSNNPDNPPSGLHENIGNPEEGNDVIQRGGSSERTPSPELPGRAKYIDETVRITDYHISDRNDTVMFDFESTKDQRVRVIDFGAMMNNQGQVEYLVEVDEGASTVTLPATDYQGGTAMFIQSQQGSTFITEAEPPFLQDLKDYYLWIVLFGAVTACALYSVHWYLKRESVLSDYQPVEDHIVGSPSRDSLVKRLIQSDEDVDEGVRGVLSRYVSIRGSVIFLIQAVTAVYVLDALGVIQVALPSLSDEVKLGVGSVVIVYAFLAPKIMGPILNALYNPSLEFAAVLNPGTGAYDVLVAKLGTLSREYDTEGTPAPRRTRSTGIQAWLLLDIDTDENTAEHADDLRVSDTYDLDTEIPFELVDHQDVGVDDILSTKERAALAFSSMMDTLREARAVKNSLPGIKMQSYADASDEVAEGIARATSGTGIEGTLERVVPDYESKTEQIEESTGESQSDPGSTPDEGDVPDDGTAEDEGGEDSE